jgi:hypothetical protein
MLRKFKLFVLFLACLSVRGQLAPSIDAFKIFRQSSDPKLRYLGRLPGQAFPLLTQKFNDWQNLSYSKYGIRKVIIVREMNGVLDTLAIRKYNKAGYLIEKDTFDLMYLKQGQRFLYKTEYDYSVEDKFVRVLSRDIVFKPDTTYDWQKSLKLVYYYDLRNRLVKRKSWHYGNDTVNMNFITDSNDVLTGLGSQEFIYYLDQKGRLIEFSRNTPYGITATRLIYDDKKHSVSVYPDKSCHDTYYFTKRRQIFLDHFCPSVEDPENHTLVAGRSNGRTVYTTIIDRKLRVKRVTVTTEVDENLNVKSESSGRVVDKYSYNRKGLLSVLTTEATSKGWDQKIIFYYFTN